MRRRYIFRAGRISAAGSSVDLWMGVEIESAWPVDLQRLSLATGFDLIPADRLAPAELASVGVHTFECISFRPSGNIRKTE